MYKYAYNRKNELSTDKVTLSFVPAICGAGYKESVKKIMVVGRAPNGWSMASYKDGGCAPESWFKANLSWVYQEGPIRCDNGEMHKPSVNHSKFWQFIRYNLSLNNPNIDTKKFTDTIVWTNLYKISPEIKGNPSDKLCDETCGLMDDILLAEIKYYQPNEIWFLTKNIKRQPEEGDKCRWIRKKEFPKTIEWLNEYKDKIKAVIYLRPENTRFDKVIEDCVTLN